MKTTRVLIALAGLLLASGQALAQPEAATTSSSDYSQEAYVVEQARTTWRFANDGTGRRELFMRVKVQSEAGVKTWGQLVFPYNAVSERLDVGFVRVTKTDGTVVTAPADAVQDLTSAVQREAPVYTDTREKHITVPGLRPGEQLEIALAIVVHTPLASGHFWGDHQFIPSGIVLDERLRLDVPLDRHVTIKTRPDVASPAVDDRDGRRIYEWHSARLATDVKKDTKEKAARRKPYEPEPPAVRMSTFASWQELGTWYRDLEQPQRAPGPEVRKKAAELTAGRSTDRDKLQALYEYVAASFRYVSLSFGVGRYQPHAAADVLQHQYGDCKDKHTLLASLAQSIGLRASAVLIHSSVALDPDVPSPSQFDHVMTRVSLPAGDIWLDSTAEVAPFGLLSPTLRKKQALVVDPIGTPALAETPAAAPVTSKTTATVDAVLSGAGALSARLHFTFSGDYELLMRSLLRQTPSAQWKTYFGRMSAREGLDGEIDGLQVTDPSALSQPFTIDFAVTKQNFVTPAKKEFDLEFPLGQWTAIGSTFDGDDDSPIELAAARESRYTLRLELPEGYTTRAPLPISVSRDYGDYRADYGVDGRVFTAHRAMALKAMTLPASRRGDVTAFSRAVKNDLKQSLGLETRLAAGPNNTSAKLKVEELFDGGSEAVDDGRYRQAVPLLKKVIELDPAYRTAWTELGRAYMGLHQTEDAIAAFRRQIEVNAYDLHAYNNLGWAYRNQQRYPEAEAAFRKQLEVDPLDAYAHESLGGIYLEQRQYQTAAPELEKAVALAPKNAMLRVRLGEALLSLGRRDDALAAFKRAVEIDPAPLTVNDIAYQLAQNRTDLDLAQRYAESAVASMTAASRTVSVDRVTEHDLWRLREMGSYWDTLGWVFFVKGDVERAERYVRAAWVLLQNGEVGYHLGQIYEKQGRRADALDAYALALKTEHVDVRTRDRLASMVGGADRADAMADERAGRMLRDRTVAVEGHGPAAAADFFIVFDNAAGEAKIESVAFASGDESLRSFGDRLRRAKYDVLFPDATAAKIVRRGTLSCAAGKGASTCAFVLTPPSQTNAEEP